MSTWKMISTQVLSIGLLCAARPAAAQDAAVWTAAWQGVWESQSVNDCVGALTSSDDVCAGEDAAPQILVAQGFGFQFDGLEYLICLEGMSGTVTDTSLSLQCIVEDFGDCIGSPYHFWREYSIQGARHGDAAMITTVWTLQEEACPPPCLGCDGSHAVAEIVSQCQAVTTMVRTSAEAPCSAVPARPSSWGELKVRYR